MPLRHFDPYLAAHMAVYQRRAAARLAVRSVSISGLSIAAPRPDVTNQPASNDPTLADPAIRCPFGDNTCANLVALRAILRDLTHLYGSPESPGLAGLF